MVSFTSANRDPAVFTQPDRLDVRRHPNPHFAFGYGPHFCLGAQLARVEIRALLAEALSRMGQLEYDGEPAFLRSNFQRGVNYPVGDFYSYTNSGFLLLVSIIERVSGMPYTAFTTERLFKPLGMTKTSWRDQFERIVPGRAQAHSRRGNTCGSDSPVDYVVGAGGMLTTVGDWLKWNDALDK